MMGKLNWREHAHLFANGKFSVSIEGFTNLRIHRYDCVNNLLTVDVILDELKPKDCQLIARHPEDMTDEEFDVLHMPKFGGDRERRVKWFRIQVLTARDMMHLLSIGVYPFPWPEDGSVIRAQ